MIDYDWSVLEGQNYDSMAAIIGTERRDSETDEELRWRLVKRVTRFTSSKATFYDLVHDTEQLLHRLIPAGIEHTSIRREVGLELINKNLPNGWFNRLRLACRASLACLFIGVGV